MKGLHEIAACALSLTIGSTAHANVVSINDTKAVGAIWKNAETLGGEIGQTAQMMTQSAAADSASMTRGDVADLFQKTECFDELDRAVSGVGEFGHALTLTLLISAEVKDRRDEELALEVVRSAFAKLDPELALWRHEANGASASCHDDAAVNVKAQAVLDLVGAAEDVFKPLARKVGAVQK